MPPIVPVMSSVVVGVVLVVAGASKLAAGSSWSDEARGLGAPRWVVPWLPWAELALGASLVVQVARRPLAAAAAGVFVCFTILLVSVLSQGRRPRCACFGVWSTRPLGPGHVVRNVIFTGLAIVAIL